MPMGFEYLSYKPHQIGICRGMMYHALYSYWLNKETQQNGKK